MRLVLGLSGRYCAGKSTIAAWLVSRGALRIDIDALGHEARAQCLPALQARFGAAAGDRKALGRLVFADPKALADLEAIVHPPMLALARERISQALREAGQTTGPYAGLVIVDAAILFQLGLHADCDLVLWVSAPFWLRYWRGMRRDRRGRAGTLALMARQDGLGPQSGAGNADIFSVSNLLRCYAFRRVAHILERYDGKE